ncbi:hypothetical protein HanIR_Chr07g0307031 [Helianthus annuus]|nr:hypothetical protein HanIR_Chr07g0307031 [Helianthus annuus]
MLFGLILRLRIDQNIVDEYNHELVEVRLTNFVHQIHKNSWRVCQPIWHNQELIMSIPSSKSSLGNTFFLYS